jgi:hypothetical protein
VPDRPKDDKSDKPMLSRLKQLQAEKKDDTWHPDMPPVEGSQYLLAYLYEIGPSMAGGMGEAPLTHEELAAWQRNTGIQLTPWEARTLRMLSMAYIGSVQEAADIDCKCPWEQSEDVKAMPNRKVTAMRDHIRNLAKL